MRLFIRLQDSSGASPRSDTPPRKSCWWGIPIAGSLFNRRQSTNRRDSVLILVTPAPAQAISARPWARPEAVERLIGLWDTVVAPGSDLATVTNHLSHSRLFKRSKASDASLDWPNLPRDEAEIFGELVLP